MTNQNKTHRLTVYCLLFVYLVSGACSLMDEVIWVRLLKLILGNTVYASSIVVSVFMGGLALGALIAGRYCDHLHNPLRVYPWIELAITVLALISPWTLRFADTLYVWFCRTYEPGLAWLRIGQIIISSMILLVPTLLMGSTLPLLGRFITSVERQTGSLVGRLYALNTLGAALGCFAAGFVLIRTVGVMGTLRIAALLNVFVACAGYVLYRVSLHQHTDEREVLTSVTVSPTEARPSPAFILLVLGFFMSGLISIAFELLWMRSIVHTVGAFTYVFSAVLTVYLLGNVIGTAMGSHLVKSLRNPAAAYAVILFFLGLCGVLYLPWLQLCSYRLLPKVLEVLDEDAWKGLITWSMVSPMMQSIILFIVPSLMMGIGFPLVLQAWVDRVHRIGWSTGAAYSTNTLGAVTGGLLTGFVLLPRWGLQTTITALGLTTFWLGALMWIVFLCPVSQKGLRRCLLPLAALCITLGIRYIPPDLFQNIVALSKYVHGCKVLAVKEGINTTVSLHEDPNTKAQYLVTSGRRVAGTSRGYRGDQKILGHFPVLLNRHAQSVLSVGFGSGESTACLTRHGIERVDCVEIAPEVVEFSLKYFQELNLGDEHRHKVNIIIMDAKNYLHLTDRTYDAIVSDCTSIRGFAENASLYTKEYFESARDHLNEHGLFMAWIDAYSTECIRVMNSVIGTVMEVYPYVSLWYMMPEPAHFFVIAGSMQPQTYCIDYMEEEFQKPGVATSLARVNFRNSVDVMSCYIADETDLKQYVKSYETNSDLFPVVEFCMEHRPAGRAAMREFLKTVRGNSVFSHLDWTGLTPQQKPQWMEKFRRAYNTGTYILMAETATQYLERWHYSLSGLQISPDNKALLLIKQSSENTLLSSALSVLDAGRVSAALDIAGVMESLDPNSACPGIIRSHVSVTRGENDKALEQAKEAVHKNPHDLRAQYNLWWLLASKKNMDQALDIINQALKDSDTIQEWLPSGPQEHLGF